MTRRMQIVSAAAVVLVLAVMIGLVLWPPQPTGHSGQVAEPREVSVGVVQEIPSSSSSRLSPIAPKPFREIESATTEPDNDFFTDQADVLISGQVLDFDRSPAR